VIPENDDHCQIVYRLDLRSFDERRENVILHQTRINTCLGKEQYRRTLRTLTNIVMWRVVTFSVSRLNRI
jgi:hypothetical protein